MKVASYIGLAVGLLVMTGLIAWQGVMEVGGLLFSTGWTLLWVPVIWIPSILMNARCWQILFAPGFGPTFRQAFFAQWMGRAVNTLLPVASLGGEVVKARTLILWGIKPTHASASAIVDKTIQALTTILWGVTGTIILAYLALDNKLATSILISIAIVGSGIAGFIIIQKAGLFGFIVKSAHKVTKSNVIKDLINVAGATDKTVNELYKLHSKLAVATLWRLIALISQTGEVWLAAYLLGSPISIIEALLLKSLSSTLSDFAFIIPNSYGVQEGAFVVLGGLIGLSPNVALAISLTIRIREFLIDVPGLVLWQHNEGRFFLTRIRSTKSKDIVD
ncbi:MAG: lysylphosphatidylglycerol synthase domain-containing protein [Pseudomonadota bacterium]|nr:lysylphosphatidylglycerol synthase domain-containing protein [Pseudomonadota bacterium]